MNWNELAKERKDVQKIYQCFKRVNENWSQLYADESILKERKQEMAFDIAKKLVDDGIIKFEERLNEIRAKMCFVTISDFRVHIQNTERYFDQQDMGSDFNSYVD